MHCELIVPGLLPASEECGAALSGLRLPALEMLLARGRRTVNEALSLERWLYKAFGGDAGSEIPAGALTVLAQGGTPGDALWMRADPVHLRVSRDNLLLVPATAFCLEHAQAERLAEAINQHFAGKFTVYPVHPEFWCMRVDTGIGVLELRTTSLADVAGRDIGGHLPSGRDAMRWHRLLNELQMLLHGEAVNEEREARGEPAVNSLWPWGLGRLPAGLTARWQSVSANDALARGLAQATRVRHYALMVNASEWLARMPENGRQLVVLDPLRIPLALSDLAAWQARLVELEERWFAPLLAALKAGRIGMLSITTPDASDALTYEAMRSDLRRFWRRPSPLAAYIPDQLLR